MSAYAETKIGKVDKSHMKDKIFSVLQRVGRSFMLPIAILPVAGLLLGIGSSFTNATTIETYGLTKILGEGTLLHSLLVIMNSCLLYTSLHRFICWCVYISCFAACTGFRYCIRFFGMCGCAGGLDLYIYL